MDATQGGRRSVPISALEHFEYCPRQAALIHVDAYFDSSVDTVRGDLAHAAVDRGGLSRDRRGQQVWHSLPVWSDTLGVHGICDAVYWGSGDPTPVEHKSGHYKPDGPADVQVAAQVLCLREMLDADIPLGVVFSGRERQRHDVIVDDTLAARVRSAAENMRRLLEEARVPAPVHDARCRRCSLRSGCIPDAPRHVRDSLFVPKGLANWDD
jgi:CRISPR-associated exonuclease Cas4